MEQLANLYQSTLAANYIAGSGTMTVASATGLPATGVFSLSIIDQGTALVKLIVTVASRAGTTLTVTAESTDTNCLLGDIVVGTMITARQQPAFLQDWLGQGAQGSLPATTGRSTGMRYKATDSAAEYLFTGSAWVPYQFGIAGLTPPDNTAFTQFNNAGTGITFTQTNTGNLITIQEAGSSTTGQICGITKAKLAATYTATFVFTGFSFPAGTAGEFGVCLTDGTKFISFMFLVFASNAPAVFFLNISKWNSATSFNSDYTANLQAIPLTGPLCFIIQEDATHRSFYVSTDFGRTKNLMLQTVVADFLTTTRYGIFLRGDSASAVAAATLYALNETNP